MTTIERIRGEQARVARLVRVEIALIVGGIVLGGMALGAMVLGHARWLTLPRWLPFLIWPAILAIGAFVYRRAMRRRRALTEAKGVAKAIEQERGLRDGAALTLLEVASLGGPFVARADALLGARLGAGALAPRLRRKRVRAVAGAALGVIPLATLLSTVGQTHGDGWRALWHPASAWAGTLLPAITFDDPPAGLLRGDTARLVVHATGRRVVTVRQRVTGGVWRDTALTVANGAAALRVGPLDADLLVLASDGRAESDTLRLKLAERSFVGDLAVKARFPSYLGRADETLAPEALLRIPEGTRLTLTGRASEALTDVVLAGGGGRAAMTVQGKAFTGEWTPRVSAAYTWQAHGSAGVIADVPPALNIEVVADSAPSVDFLAPLNDTSVAPTGTVRVAVAAADDRVLKDVVLTVFKMGADGKPTAPQSQKMFDGGAPSFLGAVAIDLEALHLVAGDVVHLQASAHDDAPSGHLGKSRDRLLKVPGVEDQRREARAAADSLVAKAVAAARAQQQLEQKTNEAAKARTPNDPAKAGDKKQNAMAFDQAEKARQVANEQRALSARSQEVQDATKELEDKLRAAGGLDSSLAQQLRDAQKMLREAMTPELQAAMKKLEGAAQELSQERTRQSMADLAEQQKRLREALEKSAEMLKRAALEGQMKTLKEDASSMAKQQKQLGDSAAGDGAKSKELAQRTADLAKEIQQLQRRLEQQRANAGARKADDAANQAQASREAMQRASDDKTGQAQRQQAAKEAAQAMQQAAQSLGDAREQQVSAWKNDVTGSMDKAVQELMQMAQKQDQLAQQTQQGQAGDTRQQQSALQQGLQKAAERLQEQAKKSAMVSPGAQQAMKDAQQRVDQAMKEANQQQSGQSQQGQANAMKEAAQSIRQAASALARDRERVDGAQSGSGVPEMIQEMQKLAQQQGELNSQMASLMPTPSQGRQAMDPSAADKARVLAKQQRAVANALDDVQDLDATGRTRELAREARTLAQALEAGATDPNTLDRQARLFRKMLDAGRLLQQEEKDEQGPRESKPGDKVTPFVPPDGSAHGRDALKYRAPTWDEMKGLAPEERRAVLEYFRRLNGTADPQGKP